MKWHCFSGIDLLDTPVLAVDSQHHLACINQSAELLFSISRGQYLHKPLDSWPCGALIEDMLRESCHQQQDVVLRTFPLPDSDTATLAISVQKLATDQDTSKVDETGWLLECHRIDQQMKTEREELQALQIKQGRELVRNLAHEIKNPLGGIRGAAQLLSQELNGTTDKHLKAYTNIIMREVDRLDNLLRRVLNSHHTIQPKALNVHVILEEIRSLLAAEYKSIRILDDYDPSLPELKADHDLLRQAILNIMRNACEAVTGKGKVVLRTRSRHRCTLAKRLYPLVLELRISDNGMGIPTELKDSLFFPLVSGRADGNGLGLSIAQDIIQRHCGVIEFDSKPGMTHFYIRLPLHLHNTT